MLLNNVRQCLAGGRLNDFFVILKMPIRQIKYGSKEYQESVDLRNKILRLPLGMLLDEEDLRKEKSDFHIAFLENNKVIGILILTPIDKDTVKMRQVAIADEYQGKGIGSGLVKFSEKAAIDFNFSKIILNARSTALGFYKKMGYETLGDEYVDESIKIPHFKMMKRIG